MTLADGSVITADLVVAADGVHSVAVGAVVGAPNPPLPARTWNCCYRFLISRAELEDDPETRFFNHDPCMVGSRVWVDPDGGRRLVSYTCREYDFKISGPRRLLLRC